MPGRSKPVSFAEVADESTHVIEASPGRHFFDAKA